MLPSLGKPSFTLLLLTIAAIPREIDKAWASTGAKNIREECRLQLLISTFATTYWGLDMACLYTGEKTSKNSSDYSYGQSQ